MELKTIEVEKIVKEKVYALNIDELMVIHELISESYTVHKCFSADFLKLKADVD